MGGRRVQVEKQHFVLVHGAGHGAWCWYKLETLLKSAGHQVTSLDMTACGIDTTQFNEIQSYSDYFAPLMKVMKSVEERVVLVAHSFGGSGVSIAMESFPDKISVAVFACAEMPGPNTPSRAALKLQSYHRSERDEMDNEYGYDNGPDKPPTSFKLGPKFMSVNVYQQCPPEDLTLATKLVRATSLFRDALVLSEARYGSVNRVFIITGADKFGTLETQLEIIQGNPPDEVYEIKGADHMVMLSRTQELWACLRDIVDHFT